MTASVRDNKDRSRFELDLGNELAFANYRLTPAAVIITHTETPRALRGRGIASELVRGALDLIRRDGKKVIAGCGFVADYLDRHPERCGPRRVNAKGPARSRARGNDRAVGQCLISGGSLPPLAASFDITCLCSQTFMLAESFMSPV